MTTLDQEFYIFPEEVFRMGNSGSHRLTVIRPDEVEIIQVKGVDTIIANGAGVSLFTLEGLIARGLTGFAWKFDKDTLVTAGLKLVNDRPGHYMLAPVHNMPVEDYRSLLIQMGLHCEKHLKINKDGSIVKVEKT